MLAYFDWRLPLPSVIQKRLVKYLIKKSLNEYLDCNFELAQLDIQWIGSRYDENNTLVPAHGHMQLKDVSLNVTNLNRLLTMYGFSYFQIKQGKASEIIIKIPSDDLISGQIELFVMGLKLIISSAAAKSNPINVLDGDIAATEFFDMTASTLLLADDFLSKGSNVELDSLLNSVEETMADDETALSDESSMGPTEAKETAELSVIASWIGKLFERLKITISNFKVSLLLQNQDSLDLSINSLTYADLHLKGIDMKSENLRNIRESYKIPGDKEKLFVIDGLIVLHGENMFIKSIESNRQELLLKLKADGPFEVFGDFKQFELVVDLFNGSCTELFRSFYKEYFVPITQVLNGHHEAKLDEDSPRSFAAGPIPVDEAQQKYGIKISAIESSMIESFQDSIINPRVPIHNERSLYGQDDLFYSVIDKHMEKDPFEFKQRIFPLIVAENEKTVWNFFLDAFVLRLSDIHIALYEFKYSISDGTWQLKKILWTEHCVCSALGRAKSIHFGNLSLDGKSLEGLISLLQSQKETELAKSKLETESTESKETELIESKNASSGSNSASNKNISWYFRQLKDFLGVFELYFEELSASYNEFNLVLKRAAFLNGNYLNCDNIVITESANNLMLIDIEQININFQPKNPSCQLSTVPFPFSTTLRVLYGKAQKPLVNDVSTLRDSMRGYSSCFDTLEVNLQKCSLYVLPLILKLMAFESAAGLNMFPLSKPDPTESSPNVATTATFFDIGVHIHAQSIEAHLDFTAYELAAYQITFQYQELFYSCFTPFVYYVTAFDIGSSKDTLITRNIQQYPSTHPSYNFMLKIVYQAASHTDIDNGYKSADNIDPSRDLGYLVIQLHNITMYLDTLNCHLKSLFNKRESLLEPFLPYLSDDEAYWMTSFGQAVDMLRHYFYPIGNITEGQGSTAQGQRQCTEARPTVLPTLQVQLTECQYRYQHRGLGTISVHSHDMIFLIPYLEETTSNGGKALERPFFESESAFKFFGFIDQVVILIEQQRTSLDSLTFIFHSIPGQIPGPFKGIGKNQIISLHQRYFIDLNCGSLRSDMPQLTYHRLLNWYFAPTFQSAVIREPYNMSVLQKTILQEALSMDNIQRERNKSTVTEKTASLQINEDYLGTPMDHVDLIMLPIQAETLEQNIIKKSTSEDSTVKGEIDEEARKLYVQSSKDLVHDESSRCTSNQNDFFEPISLLEDYTTNNNKSPAFRQPATDNLLSNQKPPKWFIKARLDEADLRLFKNETLHDHVRCKFTKCWLYYELFPRKKEPLNDENRDKEDLEGTNQKSQDSSMASNDFHVANSLTLQCQDCTVQDHVGQSLWKTFMTSTISHPQETASFQANLLAVYPNKNSKLKNDLEYRLKVSVLPLRFYIDQDTLLFLVDFFTTSNSNEKQDLPKTNYGSKFFQIVCIDPVSILLDYKPKDLSMTSLLLEGNLGELLNFVPLTNVSLQLPLVKLSGVSGGFSSLFRIIFTKIYYQSIVRQKDKVVTGIAPLRPALSITEALIHGILLPLLNASKRPINFAPSAASTASQLGKLVKSATSGTLSLSAQGLISAQTVLEKVDTYLGGDSIKITSSHSNDPEHCKTQTSKYSNAPTTVQEGISQAKASFSEPPHLTNTASILKPAIQVTKASSRAIMGIQAAVDPRTSKERKEKYK